MKLLLAVILESTNTTVPDDKMKFTILGAILGLVTSLIVSLTLFYLNKGKEKKIREAEKLQKKMNKQQEIKDEIFVASDKLIRYAIASEYATLTYRWNYAIKELNIKLGITENSREDNYFCETYNAKAELSTMTYNLHRTDLLKAFYNFRIYWDNKTEVEKMEALISSFIGVNLKTFGGIFSKKMETKEELDKIYEAELGRVSDNIINNGVGKQLLEIQKIVEPNAHFWVQDK